MAHFSQFKQELYGPNPPLPHNCQILLENGEKELAHKNILAAESNLFENALFFSDGSPDFVFKGMKEVWWFFKINFWHKSVKEIYCYFLGDKKPI